MKVLLVEEGVKFCHCKIGDVIQLQKDAAFYLVCTTRGVPETRHETKGPFSGSGLYREQDKIFLVNLETGVTRDRPHLSSKVIRCEDMALMKVHE